jgi:hypothetical protein
MAATRQKRIFNGNLRNFLEVSRHFGRGAMAAIVEGFILGFGKKSRELDNF